MATNEVFRDADHLSLPVPAGTKSGDPRRIGGLNVVAETDRSEVPVPDEVRGYTYNGNKVGNASCWLKGAHDFTVAFAVASVGLPIYIKVADNTLTATFTDAATTPLYGHALTTKSAPSGPLTVRLTN